jgi:hypothetical protein
MTATTTTYVSGVAIGDNLTSSTAASGRAKVIEHIIMVCGFPQDSTMVEYIDQQQWDKLEHVVTVELEELTHIWYWMKNMLPKRMWQRRPSRKCRYLCMLSWKST